MNCEDHASKLGDDYPGRFCIYCGTPVAEIKLEDGQIVLRNDRAQRYVAVVHGNQQKPVEWIDIDGAEPRIKLKDEENEISFSTSLLIAAFQKREEALSID